MLQGNPGNKEGDDSEAPAHGADASSGIRSSGIRLRGMETSRTIAAMTLRMKEEIGVGMTHVEGTVEGPGGRSRDVRFLVDSGAMYSLLPHDVWKDIGLAPERVMSFVLADGTAIERGVSECRIALLGRQAHTPVILGEEGDEPLLGAVTLEIFALVLDPFRRTLRPMHMRLA